jgi:hypothetical protein
MEVTTAAGLGVETELRARVAYLGDLLAHQGRDIHVGVVVISPPPRLARS